MNGLKLTTLISLIVIAVAVSSVEAAADEKPAKGKPAVKPPVEMKVLYKFVGSWRGTTTADKTKWAPEGFHRTVTTLCKPALGGRFTLSETVDDAGVTSFQLCTYDPQQKCYRMWWFNSQGSVAESRGQWDAKTKTAVWKGGDKDAGVTSLARVTYTDDDTIEWGMEAKDAAGEVSFRMKGKYARVKKLRKLKFPPAKKPAERSDEQKVLDLFVGNWKTTAEAPDVFSRTGTLSCVPILGGRFTSSSGKSSDGGSGLSLMTYDENLKCYRMWHFDSMGTTAEYRGKWDSKAKRFDLTSTDKTSDFKVQLADKDTINWSMTVKGPNDKIVFQIKGKNTRVKKPAKKKGI